MNFGSTNNTTKPMDAWSESRSNEMATKDKSTDVAKYIMRNFGRKKRAVPWEPKTEAKRPAQNDHQKITKRHKETSETDEMGLSSQQRAVLEMALSGVSLFYSGAAGTGKSYLLGIMIGELRKKYGDHAVTVTASTGLAAINVGGTTLHSFAKIGMGYDDAEMMIQRVNKNPEIKAKWRQTKVLIIDEISMITPEFFNKVDRLARVIRHRKEVPFGGIQLILTGDFFQLPPVIPKEIKSDRHYLCFQSTAWKTAIQTHCILTEVFRQKGDNKFVEMLNDMRQGKMSDETINLFKSLERPVNYTDGIEPTYLYSRRNAVTTENQLRLKNLPGKARTFLAVDTRAPHVSAEESVRYFQNQMCEKELVLKLRAQVILIKNIDDSLVNGLPGTVMAFLVEELRDLFEMADYDEDFIKMYNAIFLAKGNVPVSARPTFEQLSGDVQDRIRLACKYPDEQRLRPLVKFQTRGIGKNAGRYLYHLCVPTDFVVEDIKGKRLVTRTQIPLLLSWALSIHKAQGQTLDRVVVDLNNIFEDGQAYVAISRCTGIDRLQVKSFAPHKIRANKDVKDFYDNLENALE